MGLPVKLSYTEQGRGFPVVLLHGFPLSSAIWRDQQKGLADHYRVITPDLRGQGTSPTRDGMYTMDDLAGDVFALLDTLSVQKCVLIGHSLGGYVTLAAWKLHPERFSALGLVAARASADTEDAAQDRLTLADQVDQLGASVVTENMLPRMFAPGLSADDLTVEQTRTIMMSTAPSGLIGALKGMAARPDSTAILSEIDIPVLLLSGDKDVFMPPALTDAMAAALPNPTVISIENAGHMLMLEQPTATTESIRRFLSEALMNG